MSDCPDRRSDRRRRQASLRKGTRFDQGDLMCRMLTGFLLFNDVHSALEIHVRVGEQLEKDNNVGTDGDERTDGIRVTAVDVDHGKDE